jgi:Raf kinase inhibitor-like YbhB/YbcL family protein
LRRDFRAARLAGRAASGLAAATAIAVALGGCSFLGGLSARRSVAIEAMTVTSPVFSEHVLIPRRYTCDGIGQSPPLFWTGAPQGARSFAVVIDDSLAPIDPFTYWIVFDIRPDTTELLAGQLPGSARQARNSRGTPKYDPVCPAGQSHIYRFTVYALNARVNLRSGAPLRQAWMAIAAHVIAVGRFTASASP